MQTLFIFVQPVKYNRGFLRYFYLLLKLQKGVEFKEYLYSVLYIYIYGPRYMNKISH